LKKQAMAVEESSSPYRKRMQEKPEQYEYLTMRFQEFLKCKEKSKKVQKKKK